MRHGQRFTPSFAVNPEYSKRLMPGTFARKVCTSEITVSAPKDNRARRIGQCRVEWASMTGGAIRDRPKIDRYEYQEAQPGKRPSGRIFPEVARQSALQENQGPNDDRSCRTCAEESMIPAPPESGLVHRATYSVTCFWGPQLERCDVRRLPPRRERRSRVSLQAHTYREHITHQPSAKTAIYATIFRCR